MWSGSSPSAVVNGAAGMIIAALAHRGALCRSRPAHTACAGRAAGVRARPAGAPAGELGAAERDLGGRGDCVLLRRAFRGRHRCRSAADATARRVADSRGEPAGQGAVRSSRIRWTPEFGNGLPPRCAASRKRCAIRRTEGKPLKIEVAQGSDDNLSTIFEYTRMSVPSLMTAALGAAADHLHAAPISRSARPRGAADGNRGNGPLDPGFRRGRLRPRPLSPAAVGA